MGDGIFTRWISASCDKELKDGEEQWMELIRFLEKEVKICQQKILLSAKKSRTPSHADPPRDRRDERHPSHHTYESNQGSNCFICGATDHIATNGSGGTKIVQYFSCQKFAEMTPMQRFMELKNKGLCFQCLFPGAEKNKGKHKEGRCQRDFICKHSSHERYVGKKHVLVCEEHKHEEQNKNILQEYKTRCITRPNQVDLPNFSKDIQIHHAYICKDERMQNGNQTSKLTSEVHLQNNNEETNEDAIYMLQTISVEGRNYNIFYDTGCREFVSRYDAICHLGSRAHEELPGPITLGGVGGLTTQSPHGIFSVTLPLGNGKDATLTGACMEMITETFPMYHLKGRVEADIKAAYVQTGGMVKDLPKLMPTVGGNTDFMLGMKYNKYFPKRISNGLRIDNLRIGFQKR